jgi:hypothetical protein
MTLLLFFFSSLRATGEAIHSRFFWIASAASFLAALAMTVVVMLAVTHYHSFTSSHKSFHSGFIVSTIF